MTQFNQLLTVLFVLSFCIVQNIFAQTTTPDFIGERPSTPAHAIENGPIIDGEVLQDELWQTIPSFGNMIQNQPNSGQPATEKTEIRIAYTNTTFYLSAVCYDSQPDKLFVSDARRDASLDDMDAFIFILDTYHDGQNGFVFGTNSVGIEYDAQVDNEGQGNFNNNRQQGGTIGGFNLNWDASWEVKTQVGDYGWSAEFAIPFRTIRFKSGEDVTWGANFQRNIRKTNEIDFWAPMPVLFNLYRVSLEGTLTGLNVKNPGNLKFIPYALGAVSRNFENEDKANLRGDVGADVKYSITPALTLDLTYNTDFAQVEVDDQQVNLDRFNLFFPEKRPFFLENAGLFTVGSPGEVDLFFSRRIGIDENGGVVPIIGGARLSGRIKNTNVGFLNMFTDEVEKDDSTTIFRNNFTVARVNHEFIGKRSSIGGAFVNRTGLETEGDYNHTFAVDGRYGIGKKAQLSGFYAKTATPGIESADHSFRFSSRYQWDGWIITGAYTEVGEGFNPEVGFLQRSAFRKIEGLVFYNWRAKEDSKFLENRPHISYRSYWDFEGFQQTGFLHIDNHWVWKNGLELHTGVNFTTEGVSEDFEIFPDVIVPKGTYKHAESQLVFFTNPSKPVSFRVFSIMGGSFGGSRLINNFSLNFRFGDKFNSEFGYSRNDFYLPNGDFTANVARARLSYSFTPRIFTQGLFQYNNVADIFSANVRFGWLQQANTGLFIVYNENRDGGAVRDRSFVIKYSRMFDILK